MSFYVEVGETIGKYAITSILGKGASAIVYSAFDTELNIEVALKVLSPNLIEEDQSIEDNFITDAINTTNLKHPNLVRILGIEKDDKFTYIVMELFESDSLETILKEKENIDEIKAIKIILEVCKGLEYALKLNILHRNIKPANILINKDFETKLTGFGLEKIIQKREHFYMAGKVYGTLYYMAPELFTNPFNIDVRADIYSLGIVFYYLLTHKLPFSTDNTGEIISKHINNQFTPPNEIKDTIPKVLSDFVMKLLEKNPDNRYLNYSNLRAELEKIKNECYKNVPKESEDINISSTVMKYLKARGDLSSNSKNSSKTERSSLYKPPPIDINFELPPIINANKPIDIDISNTVLKYLKTEDELTSNLIEKFEENKKHTIYNEKKNITSNLDNTIEELKVTAPLEEKISDKYDSYNKSNFKVIAYRYIVRIKSFLQPK